MALMAIFVALMAVCSWISIPAAVPFTLQTFGVFLAVGVLGGKRGTLAVALYLYVFEEGNFQVGYAIALVLLVLVTAINLAAKWARKALKQKT